MLRCPRTSPAAATSSSTRGSTTPTPRSTSPRRRGPPPRAPVGVAEAAPGGGLAALRAKLAPRLARVPTDQLRLAGLVPEWLGARSGDLATALWLARAEHGAALDLAGYVLGVLDALAASGRERDAAAAARFLLDLRFDWERVYADPHLAYEFLREREPEPARVAPPRGARTRGVRARVLELGCGVGNDAFGFLGRSWSTATSAWTSPPTRCARSRRAPARGAPRAAVARRAPTSSTCSARRPREAARATLVYSYSSPALLLLGRAPRDPRARARAPRAVARRRLVRVRHQGGGQRLGRAGAPALPPGRLGRTGTGSRAGSRPARRSSGSSTGPGSRCDSTSCTTTGGTRRREA